MDSKNLLPLPSISPRTGSNSQTRREQKINTEPQKERLASLEKEVFKTKVQIIKLQRELDRPIENLKRVDHANLPPRHLEKHKLPDEIKLKKAIK